MVEDKFCTTMFLGFLIAFRNPEAIFSDFTECVPGIEDRKPWPNSILAGLDVGKTVEGHRVTTLGTTRNLKP